MENLIYHYEGVEVSIKPAQVKSKRFIVWSIKHNQPFSNDRFNSYGEAVDFVQGNKMKLVESKQ